MKHATKIAVCLAAAIAVTGCTSVSRGLGSITANKYAEARSGTNWVVAPPQLEPPTLSDRTVYISFRNISDAGNIDLTQVLEAGAREKGWTIVRDPQAAKYRLRASLRFFGEVDPESGGMQVAQGLGWIGGAAVGAAAGGIASTFTGGTTAPVAVGVGTGAVAGSLMQAGLSNASRPREWAMIVDFVLEERMAKPVEFQMAQDTSSAAYDTAGAGNARMTSGGTQRGGNTSVATATRRSNYYPHGLRLSAWANQMNMQQEEAEPLVIQRVENVMGQILPM